jgi:hypothetical protein
MLETGSGFCLHNLIELRIALSDLRQIADNNQQMGVMIGRNASNDGEFFSLQNAC